jgi:N4-gp56 family major capsid protein
MADAITGNTEVAATIQDIVSADIQAVLNSNVVVPGTILQYPAGKGMKKIKIPKMGKFTVATKVENVAVDAQINTFSTDDLDLDQYKALQFLVEDISELQSNVAVFSAYVTQAGQDIAVEMDQFLINVLEGVSAAAPDHKLAFADTVSLTKADVLEARKLLNVQNVPLAERFAVIHPDQEKSLLNISEFTRVNEAGSASGLRNGEFGKLFGFTFMISSQAESLKSVFYHRSHAAMAQQMSPKVEMHRDVAFLADRWSISHLYGSKVLDAGKRGVLIGTA